MLPASPIISIVFLVLYAIAGMVIGALGGWLVSLATKCGPRGVRKDSLLGSFGFLAGFIGTIFMPWHENTISKRLEGGILMTSTMNTYQHPERVAVVFALLLPLLHELYRLRRERTRQL
jgi:H+/Cl- antiporter ClcA